MEQTVYIEPGAIARVQDILKAQSPQSVFLVADPDAYEASGAQSTLSPILEKYPVNGFSTFQPNPKHADIERGVKHFHHHPGDLLIAVGGGTAIDVAKLIGICAAHKTPTQKILDGSTPITQPGPPLIAIPTTAGTGSEATHFAVVYIKERKYSLAHAYILPDYALVDSELTASLPPSLTAHTGLDALCQAVESLWSVHATDQSTMFAEQALTLVRDNLERAVHHPTPEIRSSMSQAAHLSGRAINISKTTAPHAISYTLTSRFKVPHGLAVALTLGAILVYNSQVTNQDATDPRGPKHVQKTISKINRLLGYTNALESRQKIHALMRTIGCPTTLREVGVQTHSDIQALVDNVNIERLSNNPRALTAETLRNILEGVW
jgi:alcohol dehydrogenase class IV